MRESVWRRGWNDAARFRESGVFFWLFEVIGAAIFGIGASLLIPQNASKLEDAIFPATGVAIGLGLVYAVIVGFSTALAPIRQRDAAWTEIERLQAEPDFPDVELDFSTFGTDMIELPTHDEQGDWINPHFTYYGVYRLNAARITNRSDGNVSLSFVAWLFLTGLPNEYAKGFPSPRWADHALILGAPGTHELDTVLNIPAKTSVQGDVTFVVPPWVVRKVENFHEALSDQMMRGAPGGIEITDYISRKMKRFPLMG